MRIALLGGSFDPPHLAHRQILEYLLQSGKYDEAWVLPSRQNPFKENPTPFSDRLAMCRLAFADLGKRIQVREDDTNLSGYTIDLIEHLIKLYPNPQFTFIGGSDLKDQIKEWKDSEKLQKLLDFDFLPRAPERDSPFLPLSSKKIRSLLQEGKPWEMWVEKPVAEYILQKALYSAKTTKTS